MQQDVLIELKHISKTFANVRALNDVGFSIKSGSVHALMGENGAGKSTLIKILTGVYTPDEGAEIVIDNKCLRNLTPIEAVKNGIAVTYQDFSLFPNLTVIENIGISSSGVPLCPAVSWMDMRSKEECREMLRDFDEENGFQITGQPWITPTWTATKLRWFYKNNPAILAKTWKVLLLKDYILFCLTGKTVSESSIRGFSYLFDINKREHWQEMVKYCGIQNDQMPEVIEPCKRIGSVLPQIKKILPEAGDYIVNVGTLDHIAGMLGSNAYFPGTAAESAGTVLSLSILSDTWNFDPQKKIACLIGPEAGRYILFDCCDSGGVCMEWIKNEFLSEITYGRLERLLQKVNINTAPTFLPYLTGINPPEYYPDARGAFLGLSLGHSKIDMAYSVMEGVACMLHNNLKYCEEAGIAVERIFDTLREIKYDGYINLECALSETDHEKELSKQVEFLEKYI